MRVTRPDAASRPCGNPHSPCLRRARSIQHLAAALLALTLTLSACGGSTPKLPKLATTDVVLAFGDSLTYGTGAGPSESYPVVLSELIGRPVVAAGFPGEVTAGGLERLPDVLDEVKPRIMLLCMGGNDMLRGTGYAGAEANLRAMIRLAQERGISVVLIAVPQPALFSGNAPFYEIIARDNGLPLEASVLKSLMYDNDYKSDPIHPNAKGYRKMAEAVAALLRKAGAV
ncbi:MAG TPA: arylesterase [Burkholderiales bacterium]